MPPSLPKTRYIDHTVSSSNHGPLLAHIGYETPQLPKSFRTDYEFAFGVDHTMVLNVKIMFKRLAERKASGSLEVWLSKFLHAQSIVQHWSHCMMTCIHHASAKDEVMPKHT